MLKCALTSYVDAGRILFLPETFYVGFAYLGMRRGATVSSKLDGLRERMASRRRRFLLRHLANVSAITVGIIVGIGLVVVLFTFAGIELTR